jgi:hypothetical protein
MTQSMKLHLCSSATRRRKWLANHNLPTNCLGRATLKTGKTPALNPEHEKLTGRIETLHEGTLCTGPRTS